MSGFAKATFIPQLGLAGSLISRQRKQVQGNRAESPRALRASVPSFGVPSLSNLDRRMSPQSSPRHSSPRHPSPRGATSEQKRYESQIQGLNLMVQLQDKGHCSPRDEHGPYTPRGGYNIRNNKMDNNSRCNTPGRDSSPNATRSPRDSPRYSPRDGAHTPRTPRHGSYLQTGSYTPRRDHHGNPSEGARSTARSGRASRFYC